MKQKTITLDEKRPYSEYEVFGVWYVCTECDSRIFENDNYCPNCGVKINWVDSGTDYIFGEDQEDD
jgi:rRNA maturation endonuclease Nob1